MTDIAMTAAPATLLAATAPITFLPSAFTAHVVQPTALIAKLEFAPLTVTGLLVAAELLAPPRQDDLVDRAAVTVPIAPDGPLSETSVYEDPAGGPRRSVPRYSLRREALRFRSQATTWDLTVVLDPTLADAATQAIEHSVEVWLTYDLGTTGTSRRLRFGETLHEAGAVRAVASGTDPSERDWIFQALNDASCKARLEVRRTCTVAVPVITATEGPRRPRVEVLKHRKLLLEQRVAIAGRPTVAPLVQAAPRAAAVDMRVMARPLRPGGLGGVAGRLGGLDPIDVVDVRPEVPDVVVEPEPETTTVTRYRLTTTTFDQILDPVPLFVPIATNPEVFVGIASGGSAAQVQLIPRVVGGHVYLQERAGSTTFYYLPDDLRLARHVRSPHYPVMTIGFRDDDGALDDVEQAEVDLAFAVVPYTKAERLQAAKVELAAFAPGPYPEHIDGPQLSALSPMSDRLRFSLDLTGAKVTTDALALIEGFICRASMPLATFRPVYDALIGAGTMVKGTLEVPLGGDSPQTYRVTFAGRLADATCPVSILDLRDVTCGADGRVTATLVNAIESPVRITQLPLFARLTSGALAPAQLVTPELSAGLDLAPGAAVALEAVATLPEGGVASSLELGAGGVEVILDRELLYAAVIDATVEVELTRNLSVKVSRQIFDNDPSISSLHIDVRDGDAVVQDRPPPGTTRWLDAMACPVAIPIASAVIGNGELPTALQYRLRALRATSGQETWDPWGSWIDDDPGGDTLLVAAYG